MVVKVTDKEISTKERATGEFVSVPYGMVVWSTGIGPRPQVVDFMKQIGQTNRRALATDEWLRVEGCDGVYAFGDCATINQRKVMVISEFISFHSLCFAFVIPHGEENETPFIRETFP